MYVFSLTARQVRTNTFFSVERPLCVYFFAVSSSEPCACDSLFVCIVPRISCTFSLGFFTYKYWTDFHKKFIVHIAHLESRTFLTMYFLWKSVQYWTQKREDKLSVGVLIYTILNFWNVLSILLILFGVFGCLYFDITFIFAIDSVSITINRLLQLRQHFHDRLG